MKKLLLFGGFLLLLSLKPIEVDSQGAGNTTSTSPRPALSWEAPASVIDNIAVPYEVLSYAQTEYQGYAVTNARKITRDGQQVYQLTVDRDDQPYNNAVIYLYYDMQWKLLGDEKAMPRQQETKPAETPAVAPPPQPQDLEVEDEPEDEEEDTEDEEEDEEDEEEEEQEELPTPQPRGR